jgi:hypothetical protein
MMDLANNICINGQEYDGAARDGSRLQGTRDWMGHHSGVGIEGPECWVGIDWAREWESQVT